MRAAIAFRNAGKLDPYEAALRQAGIEPVRISPDVPRSLASLEGLVLTGGTDVNPTRYGQPPAPETDHPDDPRDQLETRLVQEVLATGKPLLAICRGMQLLNVVCGGTLIQHLPSSSPHRFKKPGDAPGRHSAAHTVRVAPGTRLESIIGEGEHEMNSRHHQAVDQPGEGLIVSAVSSDGVIEALEQPGEAFVVAVQWHPEDRVLVSEADRRLFEAFAEEVARFAALLERGPERRAKAKIPQGR
ncbi:MAG TPA: gamma-glutamyl-gamma-aminobutyrate hydrolase family protein [Bryobacteraceae bacterium]|nr:gamma-glutamyl-gamma-aminobutyrate hydrolase family protein [Bryobacteraceae bacterium]